MSRWCPDGNEDRIFYFRPERRWRRRREEIGVNRLTLNAKHNLPVSFHHIHVCVCIYIWEADTRPVKFPFFFCFFRQGPGDQSKDLACLVYRLYMGNWKWLTTESKRETNKKEGGGIKTNDTYIRAHITCVNGQSIRKRLFSFLRLSSTFFDFLFGCRFENFLGRWPSNRFCYTFPIGRITDSGSFFRREGK
jgi:hypothetical protein